MNQEELSNLALISIEHVNYDEVIIKFANMKPRRKRLNEHVYYGLIKYCVCIM